MSAATLPSQSPMWATTGRRVCPKRTEDKRDSISTQMEDCRQMPGRDGRPVVGELDDEPFSA